MEEEELQQRRLGAGVYGRQTLRVYDRAVLGVTNRLVWRCSSSDILSLYTRFATANHLDVGVGSGFFLDRATFPGDTPRIALLDLSLTSLEHAAARLARYGPTTYRADILRPIEIDCAPFDSIGMTYLLHCLPGPMTRKAVALDNLMPLLSPGGVLFGATVVRHGADTAPQAAALMTLYNAVGAFGNSQDSVEDLDAALDERFVEHELDVRGSVAMFWARRNTVPSVVEDVPVPVEVVGAREPVAVDVGTDEPLEEPVALPVEPAPDSVAAPK